MICSQRYLICYFVWTFLIGCEHALFSCACHSFYATKDKIVDLDRVELDVGIMEPFDAELIELGGMSRLGQREGG